MLTEAVAQVEEVARLVRAYSEEIEPTPERLTVVEERSSCCAHWSASTATIEDVLEFGSAPPRSWTGW